jgi:uncharacterized protein
MPQADDGGVAVGNKRTSTRLVPGGRPSFPSNPPREHHASGRVDVDVFAPDEVRLQLACTEPEKAWDFYRELFGWKIEGGPAPEGGGFVHANVDTGGPGAQGGISSSPTGQPHVMMYARVDDLNEDVSRAESLGGTIATPPMKVDEHTSIAVFQDPQGTTFGLYIYKE